MTRLLTLLLFVFVVVTSSKAQFAVGPFTNRCLGKIYSGKEVEWRARIIDFKRLTIPKEAAGHDIHGTVIIEAVLCRNGQVTDITVVKGLPFGITESAIDAVRNIGFSPAQLNFHSVSERRQFEFNVNEVSAITDRIDPAAAAGRLVEELDIIGNRRLTKEDILAWILTRPGDPYKADLVQEDLKSILKTGNFDRRNTRVTLEDAVRGGVRVVFEVVELRLIGEVRFEGLKLADQSAIINELARQRVKVVIDMPLDPVQLERAVNVIEHFFQSQGWMNIKAEALIENLSDNEVKVLFKISGHNFRS